MRANREAFRRWRIVPRFLRDVERRDLTVEVLGQRFPGTLSVRTGRRPVDPPPRRRAGRRPGGARRWAIPMILSTLASRTIEEVAAALGDTPRWFQLYWPRSEAIAASFLRRAEDAGYSALVVTLDTFYLGWRERDLQHAYLPFNLGAGLANYFSDPVFSSHARHAAGGRSRRGHSTVRHALFQPRAHLGESGVPPQAHPVADPAERDPCARRRADGGGTTESTASSSPTTAAGSSTGPSPPSMRCPGSSRPSPAGRWSCSTAASAAGRTSSRPWPSGPALCCSAARSATAWPWAANRGCATWPQNLLADIDLTLALMGCASLAELGRHSLVEASTHAARMNRIERDPAETRETLP